MLIRLLDMGVEVAVRRPTSHIGLRDEIRPFETFSALLFPPEDQLMAILRAYLDDSGSPDDPAHSFLTIAGYVAEVGNWKRFERRWQKKLDRAEVPYLHI
jgi:hypothetical protein